MSVDQIHDTFSYMDDAGKQRAAERVAVSSPDGSEVGSVTAVDVLHADGVSAAGASEILPADDARTSLTVRNASDTQMRLRVDGAESGPADYPLDAGRGYEFPPNMVPKGAVSIYCASAGKAWNAMFSTNA